MRACVCACIIPTFLLALQPSLSRVAALTCGLFVEVESGGFERHLATLLPLIEDVIQPEKYDVVR